MAWLNHVRNQPTEKKITLVWIILGAATVVLVIVWIMTSRVKKDLPKDTRLFDTVDQGFQDLKSHSLYNLTPPQQ